MPIVTGILKQHFMRADGSHPVVNALAPAGRLAFNPIERIRMDHRSRRPRIAVDPSHAGYLLRRCAAAVRAELASSFRARRLIGHIVAGNHPGARNGIFPQLHACKENTAARQSQHVISLHGQSARVCYNPPTQSKMTEPSTPLMRQYTAIKREHPTALLFFRLGDFYELFFDDAVLASKELQITLTSRNKEKGIAVPMCGVPYHAAEGYISKLIRKGFKVAICDQMESTKLAKKLVRREVTRVVTPGTAADSSLSSEENNFLAALARVEDRVGFAALDLSTGEFRATEFSGEDAARRIQEELAQLRPREVLYGSSAPLFDQQRRGNSRPQPNDGLAGCAETPLDDWIFAPDHAIPLLENQFGVLSLEGFGLAGKPAAASAAGAILYYVRSTQRGSLHHVDRVGFYERQNCLVLDAVTVRNLELIEITHRHGIQHQAVLAFVEADSIHMMETSALRGADVIENGAGRRSCSRLSRQAESLKREHTKLIFQQRNGVIGSENPVIQRRLGATRKPIVGLRAAVAASLLVE